MMSKKTKQKNNPIVFFSVAACSLAAVFFLLKKGSADTGSISELSETSKESQKKIEELEKRADIYREIINIKKKQSATLSDQIEVTEVDIDQIQSEINVTKQKIDDYNSQILRLENQINEKEEFISNQKRILSDLMQAFYEVNKSDPVVSYLSDGNIASFMVTKDRLSQTGDEISQIVISIKKIKSDLESQKIEVEKNKTSVVSSHEKLQDQNQTLESAKKQREKLLAQTKSEENKYQDLLKKTQEQIQEEIEEIESGKSEADLGPLPPSKSGLFIYPVNPVVITQSYGKTGFSNNYSSGKHNGVDFGVKYKNVFAAKDGTILATGDCGKYAYGKWVAIDHGDGLVTLYGHFSKTLVSKGKKVKSGDTIGVSGNTGFSTGPHLHFTVFAKKTFEIVESTKVSGLMLPTGASVNPMNYL